MALEHSTVGAAKAEGDELQRAKAEIAELRQRLLEAEQELAALPALRQREEELDRLRTSAAWRLAELSAGAARPFRRALTALRGTAVGRVLFRLRQSLRS